MPGPQPVPGPAGARPGAVRSAGGSRRATAGELAAKGSTACTRPSPSRWCRPNCSAPRPPPRQRRAPLPLRFGLQLSSFGGLGAKRRQAFADRLAEVAGIAEAVGFTSLWVMDHMVQIPQVGRRWEDMPESWTTLAWCAARTSTIRLGTLVTGVTLRNPAHLAKIVATVDVLSGGRAICGLGPGLVGVGAPRTGGRSRPRRSATPCSRTPWACCR